MKNFMLIMIISLAVCNSCSILDSEPESESYFPLKIGNTWYYNRVNYDHNPYMKLMTESKIILDENTYYVVKNIMFYSEPGSYSILDTLRIDSQGRIWKRIMNEDILMFDFSLEDSSFYNFSGYSRVPEDGCIVMVRKVNTIEVDGKKYEDCIEFFFEWHDYEKFYIFCRGIGLIKETVGEGLTIILDSYTF